MKIKKTIYSEKGNYQMINKILCLGFLAFLSSATVASTGLTINNSALSEPGDALIRTISGKIQRMNYLVNLRRNTQDYFDVLNLLIYLNQSSQLEKKIDILISETRRNNKLLERVLMEKTKSNKS